MANLSITIPDETLSKLLRLESGLDDIIGTALEEGGKIAVEELREQARRVISTLPEDQKRQTGQMINSIGVTKASKTKDGNAINIKVGFSEPRQDGKKNAFIASVIESGKSGQKARPFIRRAFNKSKGPVTDRVIEVFNEAVDKA